MAATFNRVKVARASEDVVEQIKEAIFSGRLTPGDRLPPERELVREFGLSRVTVREAIRMLEAAGVVRVKTGASGGAFVVEASSQIVSNSLTTLLRLQKATIVELSEARKVVETAIAEMAAIRAEEDDLIAMELAIEHTRQAIDHNASYPLASLEFHTSLAKAAKNRVLLSMVDSFREPLNEALDELDVIEEMPMVALEHHKRLCDAIRRRDSVAARHLMEIHLQYFDEKLRELTEGEKSVSVGGKVSLDS